MARLAGVGATALIYHMCLPAHTIKMGQIYLHIIDTYYYVYSTQTWLAYNKLIPFK